MSWRMMAAVARWINGDPQAFDSSDTGFLLMTAELADSDGRLLPGADEWGRKTRLSRGGLNKKIGRWADRKAEDAHGAQVPVLENLKVGGNGRRAEYQLNVPWIYLVQADQLGDAADRRRRDRQQGELVFPGGDTSRVRQGSVASPGGDTTDGVVSPEESSCVPSREPLPPNPPKTPTTRARGSTGDVPLMNPLDGGGGGGGIDGAKPSTPPDLRAVDSHAEGRKVATLAGEILDQGAARLADLARAGTHEPRLCRLNPKLKARFRAGVAAALAANVPADVIREDALAGFERAGNPAAVFAARPGNLAEAPPDDLPTAHTRTPEWCGECDELDRTVELPNGSLAKCPTCHPANAGGTERKPTEAIA